jgi:V/A-type H+-transporting ATPase subunit E
VTVTVEPARRSLLERERADAERLLAEADERAAEIVAQADADGQALVAQARGEGEAAASLEGAQEQAHARRAGRSAVLGARRELFDELRREARKAVLELRNDPALLDRLEALAREQLGDGAVITRDDGVRAVDRSRSVDYTLESLAERALGELGAEVERLWA